jgi:hypothetical protein
LKGSDSNLYLALLHYPVYNKNGEVIASAVSNLDLHDISRAGRTYGVAAFYVVTPLKDQRGLVRRILTHWTQGAGAAYNPDRRAALELVRIMPVLDEALDEISATGQGRPVTVVTDAQPTPGSIGYGDLSEMLKSPRPLLLIFGTAWGLTREFLETADYILAPITGPTVYNHLSVRSAAAIVLDRLLGTERV